MSFKYLILSVLLVWSCSQKQDKILPEYRLLTELVYSSVTVQPDSLYEAYSIVSGILDKNLIEEGQLVLKDAPLIQIINSTPLINTQNSKLALDLAKENFAGNSTILKGLQDDIATATLQFKNDSINYLRQKNIYFYRFGKGYSEIFKRSSIPRNPTCSWKKVQIVSN